MGDENISSEGNCRPPRDVRAARDRRDSLSASLKRLYEGTLLDDLPDDLADLMEQLE